MFPGETPEMMESRFWSATSLALDNRQEALALVRMGWRWGGPVIRL